MRAWQWPSLAGMAIAVLTASFGMALPAEAATRGLFPVQSHLVPAVVAATFILPAALAGVLSAMRRLQRSPGKLLGLLLIAMGAAGAILYVNPGLLATLGG